MKLSNSFVISLLGVASLTAIALLKGLDVSIGIVGIIGSYVASRSAEKAAMVHSASKDPSCSTSDIVDKVKG